MTIHRLEVDGLACGFGSTAIIRGLSFRLQSGEGLCVLGPNGVGKTTFLRTVLGLQPPLGGTILFDGSEVRRWSRRDFARAVAYVPQSHSPPFPFHVIDVVVMGRTAHLQGFTPPTEADRGIAEKVLDDLGISHLAERPYTQISGGERQMVLIGRAMAQQPQFLILDEPTSNLDFGNQIRVIEQIRRLSANGMGIIMNSHVPSHAVACSSKVLLVECGGRHRLGPPEAILSEDNVGRAYGIEVDIVRSTNRRGDPSMTWVPVVDLSKYAAAECPTRNPASELRCC